MSYQVLPLSALVLSLIPVGESSALVTLLSPDMGRVRARAQSLREVTGKMRYALQPYSFADVELVQGRYGYRLVGARPGRVFALDPKLHPDARAVFARLSALVERLVPESEAGAQFYDLLVQAADWLGSAAEADQIAAYEILFVVLVLDLLGYWQDGEDSPWLTDDSAAGEPDQYLADIFAKRRDLTGQINQSLSASQL